MKRIWWMTGLLLAMFALAWGPASIEGNAKGLAENGVDGNAGARLKNLFLEICLDETSVENINQRLKAVSNTQKRAEIREKDIRDAKYRLDKHGGGPVRWKNFYGRVSQDWCKTITGAPMPRPEQFDKFYEMISDRFAVNEKEYASLGQQKSDLLNRRRELEVKLGARWGLVAFEMIGLREIPVRKLFHWRLVENVPKKSEDVQKESPKLAMMRAAILFLRSLDSFSTEGARLLQSNMPAAGQAYEVLRDEVEKARAPAREAAVLLRDKIGDQTEDGARAQKIVARLKTVPDVATNIASVYKSAFDPNVTDAEQQKENYKKALLENLLNFAQETIGLDDDLMAIAKEWKIDGSPDDGVNPDEPAKNIFASITPSSPSVRLAAPTKAKKDNRVAKPKQAVNKRTKKKKSNRN